MYSEPSLAARWAEVDACMARVHNSVDAASTTLACPVIESLTR